LCEIIIARCEGLAHALQSEKRTAMGAAEAAKVLRRHLRRIRNEDEFDHLYSQSEHAATELDLSQQVKSRRNTRVSAI